MSRLAHQMAAATKAANNDIAAGGSDFYSLIGNASGSALWSLAAGTGTITSATQVPAASVTKSLAAIVAAKLRTLTASDYALLTMTAGHDLMQGNHCPVGDSVTQCANELTTGGFKYGGLNPAHVGLFSYDGGSWQYYFDTVLGLGADLAADLKTLFQTNLGLLSTDISFTTAMPSGGAQVKPTTLTKIAQQIMVGTYNIKTYLLDANAPVKASAVFGPAYVFSSPAPSAEKWLYKYGLWIEPITGDYWMAGSFGTAVWIKSDFSMYGMVVRNAKSEGSEGGEMGVNSIRTMQAIRQAFLQGANKWANAGVFGADGLRPS